MDQTSISTKPVLSNFARDVQQGLTATEKHLSSRYFYDAEGDKLFQEIMQLEEYYPTRTELEVFQQHKDQIMQSFGAPFRLIELGAGDGMKTKVLLNHFLKSGVEFTYSPVDISADILVELENDLLNEMPNLQVEVLAGDYFHVMSDVVKQNDSRNIVFFLGSNIGNYEDEVRSEFLSKLHDNLKKGDLVFIGFDLKKDPKIILDAYFDPKGVTTAFNKNLLTRMNRELGANFDSKKFQHFPSYNPKTGECRSYLLSREDQSVYIESLEKEISFHQWESIFMEVSRKFDLHEISQLAEDHGYRLKENFSDTKNWFVDSVWEVQ